VFADRIPLVALERVLAVGGGGNGSEQVIEGPLATTTWLSRGGGSLTTPVPNVAPFVYTIQHGAFEPSDTQFALSLGRALTEDVTATATYTYARGHHLPRTMSIGRAFELQPTADSWYRGLTLAVSSRLAHEIEWSTSYTRSRAEDTASDFDEQPGDPRFLSAERAPSRYDQPHRLVANALIELPIGDTDDLKPGEVLPAWARVLSNLEVAPILTVASGQPVNPITGGDEYQTFGWPLTARPVGFGRNSLRSPKTATLDVRLLKFFNIAPHGKLDLVVEAFNVLNRTNVIGLNPVYGSASLPSPRFAGPLDAADPRHIEFSVDFEF